MSKKRGRGAALLQKSLSITESDNIRSMKEEITGGNSLGKKSRAEILPVGAKELDAIRADASEPSLSSAMSTESVSTVEKNEVSEEIRIVELFKALLITYSFLKSKRQPTFFHS